MTPQTVQRWARAGRLKGTKRGDEWRFTRSDVETYLRGGETGVMVEKLLRSVGKG